MEPLYLLVYSVACLQFPSNPLWSLAVEVSVPKHSQNQALGTRAYEASRLEDQTASAALAVVGGGVNAVPLGDGGLSADHQLLCQIGNCLQLDAVSILLRLLRLA